MWYNPNGELQEGRPLFVYQPFTPMDLLNWKNHTPSYTEKPQAMADLIHFIIQTHKPTWQDSSQMLLSMEEQKRVVQAAFHWFEVHANGTNDV
jgi:hypothetical protein